LPHRGENLGACEIFRKRSGGRFPNEQRRSGQRDKLRSDADLHVTFGLTARQPVDNFAAVRPMTAAWVEHPSRRAAPPMYSRYVVPLLCASALAFACGPRSHRADVPASADLVAADTTDDGLAASLDVRTGDEVEFALRLTNATDRRVELAFPSGQTHEIVVFDAAGREVWR